MRKFNRNLVCWIAVLGVMLGTELASAIDEKTESQELIPDEVSEDYFFQGEFAGEIKVEGKEQKIGLQIIAQDKRTFSAALYFDGLPGDGWDGSAPTRMTGTRTDNLLVLSGSDWALLAKRNQCLVIDNNGKKIGRLQRIVRSSPTMGAKPVRGAIVLFDGENTDQFTIGQLTESGLLMQGADLKPMFQDFNLHLEFQLSFMPSQTDQKRSNSGIYLQSRYEVQVLDTFGLDPVFNGCGALYRYRQPDVNMCLPPLAWQTYDIVFTSPRFAADGGKLQNARITVWHNGTRIHNNVELTSQTGAGKMEESKLLPIRFQNHNDQVRYRNIWLVDRGATPPRKFPVIPVESSKQSSDKRMPKKSKK